MMTKPSNYEEVKPSSNHETLTTGGHYLTILSAEETKSKRGKLMLVIEYDTHITDHQPNWFRDQYERAKQYSNDPYYRGTHYLMLTDEDWAVKNLKSFVTSVEKSNADFEFDWDTKSLVGKNVGGVFGEVESESPSNGKIYTNVELRWFCSEESVPTANKPAKRELTKSEPEPIKTDVSDLPFDL